MCAASGARFRLVGRALRSPAPSAFWIILFFPLTGLYTQNNSVKPWCTFSPSVVGLTNLHYVGALGWILNGTHVL